MPKKLIYVIVAILIILLGIWSPWQKWNMSWFNLLGIETKDEYSGLKVISLSGKVNVYLDDEYQGSVDETEGFLEIVPVTPGEHLVTLSRDGGTDFYTKINRRINFEPSIDVIIGYEIGPSEEFSEGHILSAKRSFIADKGTKLDVFSEPEGVEVKLDGRYVGHTPINSIELDISSKHKVLFTKEGYDPLEIEILPESQEERDKLQNYLLELEVNLFTQPVDIVIN